MSFLKIDNISLHLEDFSLHNINMNLPKGKVTVILGPSGAGKSVLLETIAGFYHPPKGRIWLEGRDITNQPPEERQIGFMFQDHALFPHMTVRQNILFPLRVRRRGEDEKSIDPGQIISMLQIEKLTERYPDTLSGGEKQRAALARTLMRKPKLILFDEPMSSLDARIREELRGDLSQLLRELALTSIYVTHDQEEAFALADILSIMNEGRLIQSDSREDVFNHPATPFAARFVGMENLLKGRVLAIEKEDAELWHFIIEIDSFGPLVVAGNYKAMAGDEVIVGIRPENILVEPGTCSGDSFKSSLPSSNILPVAIKTIIPLGIIYKLHLTGKTSLTVFLTKQQMNSRKYAEGNSVMVGLPPAALHLIRMSRGRGY